MVSRKGAFNWGISVDGDPEVGSSVAELLSWTGLVSEPGIEVEVVPSSGGKVVEDFSLVAESFGEVGILGGFGIFERGR